MDKLQFLVLMKCNIFLWIPLKMHMQLLHMCWWITWPVSRELQLHFWDPWPLFACSLCNFYWATTMIKGHFLSNMSNIAAVFVQKFLNPIEIGPQSGYFRVNGGLNVKLWARDLPMHGIASFDLFCFKVGVGVLSVDDLKDWKTKYRSENRACADTKLGIVELCDYARA